MSFLPPRKMSLLWDKPIAAYSDASGSMHLGCVAVIGGKAIVLSQHLPGWVNTWDGSPLWGIYEAELCAAILRIMMLSEVKMDNPIILFVDNQSVLYTLIKGRGPSPYGDTLRQIFWRTVSAMGRNVWLEYIRTSANVADAPSRWRHGCTGEKKKRTDEWPDWAIRKKKKPERGKTGFFLEPAGMTEGDFGSKLKNMGLRMETAKLPKMRRTVFDSPRKTSEWAYWGRDPSKGIPPLSEI